MHGFIRLDVEYAFGKLISVDLRGRTTKLFNDANRAGTRAEYAPPNPAGKVER